MEDNREKVSDVFDKFKKWKDSHGNNLMVSSERVDKNGTQCTDETCVWIWVQIIRVFRRLCDF
jgi:hypothetical protein